MEIIVLPKHRGRQPAAYGPRRCFWCYRKTHLSLDSFLYHCVCGWSGTFPMAERADGVRYEPSSHHRAVHRRNGTGEPEGS